MPDISHFDRQLDDPVTVMNVLFREEARVDNFFEVAGHQRSLRIWFLGTLLRAEANDFRGVMRGVVGARDAKSAPEDPLYQAAFAFLLRDADAAARILGAIPAKKLSPDQDAARAILLGETLLRRSEYAAAAEAFRYAKDSGSRRGYAALRLVATLVSEKKLDAGRKELEASKSLWLEAPIRGSLDLRRYADALSGEIERQAMIQVLDDKKCQPKKDAGPLSNDSIKREMIANFNFARHCYEYLLPRMPAAQGTVTVRFVLGVDGCPISTTVVRSDIDDEVFKSCMMKRTALWAFPKPKAAPYTFEHPFVFTSR